MFQTCLSGRLTRDAELRYTSEGMPVANLSLAHNTRRKNDAGKWEDGETVFFEVTVWGRLAETAADLIKGEPITVTLTPGSAPRARAWIGRDGTPAAGMAFTANQVARTMLPVRDTNSV